MSAVDEDGDGDGVVGADTDAKRVGWAGAGGVRILWVGMYVCVCVFMVFPSTQCLHTVERVVLQDG